MTTGGFSSFGLLKEEEALVLPSLTNNDAIEIGLIAVSIGRERSLPVSFEVRIGEWTIFHAALDGAKTEHDWWIARKARVVNLKHHATIYERVLAEEQGIDWYQTTGLSEEQHATHGGGLALNVVGLGLTGVLIISGLPQVDDHLLGVEILTEYLARKGEEL